MMGGTKRKSGNESEAADSSLAEMKAEQARLAEKIDALERERSKPETKEPATDREPDPVS